MKLIDRIRKEHCDHIKREFGTEVFDNSNIFWSESDTEVASKIRQDGRELILTSTIEDHEYIYDITVDGVGISAGGWDI